MIQEYELTFHTVYFVSVNFYKCVVGSTTNDKYFLRNFSWQFHFTLMMFSFLQRRCHPLTRCIKIAEILLTSPVIM